MFVVRFGSIKWLLFKKLKIGISCFITIVVIPKFVAPNNVPVPIYNIRLQIVLAFDRKEKAVPTIPTRQVGS